MRQAKLIALALPFLPLLATSALTSACFDTQDEFDKFLDRSEPFRKEPVAGECLGPVDLSGQYLLGIEVSLDRSKPLRYVGNFTIDTATSPWSLSLTIQALKTADGTPTGEQYTATSPVDDGGAFVLDFGEITVPPEADPILPTADVKANLTIDGCTSTAIFACGLVKGDITFPVSAPLAGSTFGLVPLPDGTDSTTLELVSHCPES